MTMGYQGREDETTSRKQRVVLLESESLLAAGVANLLLNLSDIEVVRTAFGELEGMDALALMNPDVLILEDKLLQDHLVDLVQLTESCPRLRAVILNTGQNLMQVFDKRIVQVERIGDFLDVLSGENRWEGKREV